MSAFLTSGIYLQKIELPDPTKIIIKILRNIDRTSSGTRDYFKDTTRMALHIKDKGRTIKLDFDPRSDINVIKDNHIDQH